MAMDNLGADAPVRILSPDVPLPAAGDTLSASILCRRPRRLRKLTGNHNLKCEPELENGGHDGTGNRDDHAGQTVSS